MINIVAWARLDALAEKADFLDGFFKLVGKLVNKDDFPIFFNDLYIKGEVPYDKCPNLFEEVLSIQGKLKYIKVDIKLVENESDFAKVDNYKKFLDSNAKNMSDLFLNPNKDNLIEVFKFNIDYAIKKKVSVYIKYYLM